MFAFTNIIINRFCRESCRKNCVYINIYIYVFPEQIDVICVPELFIKWIVL